MQEKIILDVIFLKDKKFKKIFLGFIKKSRKIDFNYFFFLDR